MAKSKKKTIEVEAIVHEQARRRNIPTAEFESVMREEDKSAQRIAYERRNRDLDPQLVWRGKDEQDWSELIVPAPPLYIQEKVHPKVIIDDLRRESKARAKETAPPSMDLFADFNGLPDIGAKTEFYQHDQNWSNRMILGDSLSVMASLSERESLRGQVQCIYLDPPYGIKFNSNFQWSTTSPKVKDGDKTHITREPEQVRAFRDTWRDEIHSYLTYLRDRLTVARDLLHESGSIFVQIGDENVHRVRAVMDEVFGPKNFIAMITFKKTHYQESDNVSNIADYLILYAKSIELNKHRKAFKPASLFEVDYSKYTRAFTPDGIEPIPAEWREDPTLFEKGWRPLRSDITLTQDGDSGNSQVEWRVEGRPYFPGQGRHWRTHEIGRERLAKAGRVNPSVSRPFYIEGYDDSPSTASSNIWTESLAGAQGKVYVVQTNERVVERCILMTTDPGDLVLDPTCGAGTTAYVAEQWGRRWITIDTSRVALALARSRIMGARYPYYLLADTPEGQMKEAEVTRSAPRTTPTRGDIRQGFVYERVPHITLKSIANNAEIDVLWDKAQETLEPLRASLNKALAKKWEEWEVPHEPDAKWSVAVKDLHSKWWAARVTRQKQIDASIAAKADSEYLYDKPYPDNTCVRVAGPFTVESLSPHRVLTVGARDELLDVLEAESGKHSTTDKTDDIQDFATMVLDNLKAAGVQQVHKEDKITFTALTGWPGRFICAEGKFMEGEKERRAGIFIGPEFGTVSRPDLVGAAREAGDAGFDVLIACAFNYDAHSAEFEKLGRVPVLKARMNPDLHMSDELKATASGNLFVVFGEPDITIENASGDRIRVKINGIDVFKPQTGEIESGGPDSIALWMIDTDYNEESFFVRHAYFLGANDPYKTLKTTLKAEIDEEAWTSLHSDTSRPFSKPTSGRIAVKVINHLGDEVMKVFAVG